ncbi:protein FAM210A [Biomphalaria pfeifferi]|uniref:Protein FAM210A n=1 Tax=Biomphalaria pfeifferi TaxID=112525 RepID=A0AAD8FGU8_BIOPF|nr:protein FAM210A [Biomphalaria pfeifferi]
MSSSLLLFSRSAQVLHANKFDRRVSATLVTFTFGSRSLKSLPLNPFPFIIMTSPKRVLSLLSSPTSRFMCKLSVNKTKILSHVSRSQSFNLNSTVFLHSISRTSSIFIYITGTRSKNSSSSSIRSCDKDEQYKLISRPIHTINTNLFDLLTINPVQFTNLRYIRYKTQIRSQHQDQTKKDINNASVTANIQKIDKKDQTNTKESEVAETVVTEKPSLYQRFKQTYKQHGKILIAVHLCTSAFWFSSLYLSVRSGLDIVPYLEKWNISEKVISPFRSGGLGSLAVTLLLYKMIAPVRYASTLGGTNLAIKYLRREGKMKEIPQEDRLRSLYKEGKENLKTKSKARIKKLRRKSKLTKGSKNDSN